MPNTKPLGLVILENFSFDTINILGKTFPQGRANAAPRGMIWTNLEDDHHTKLQKKNFESFHYINIKNAKLPQGGANFDPRGMMWKTRHGTTIWCYLQITKPLFLAVSTHILKMISLYKYRGNKLLTGWSHFDHSTEMPKGLITDKVS